MEYLKFTDFRNHSRECFEKIEDGESYIIIRKGKPVAKILPFNQKQAGWKRKITRIKLNKTDKTTIDFISEERNDR